MNIELLKNISLSIGIIVPILGGIWFFMTRAKSWGAKSKKLDVLADAISDLKTTTLNIRTELKEEMASVKTELKEDIGKLDVKIDNTRAELKEEITFVKTEQN
jgi:hypothetical protein